MRAERSEQAIPATPAVAAPRPGRDLLEVCLISLLLTLAFALRTTPQGPGHADFLRPWDHHKYLFMASGHLLDLHIAPFCWRLGAPALASLLPLPPAAAFSLLAALAVFLTGVVVHALCRRAGFSRELALTGLLLYFTVSFAAKNSLHDACGADPLALLAVTLAIYLTLARRDALLALVLVAGVLVKESTLFVAPLVYTLRARRLVDWPALGPALLVGAPAVLALVAVRLAVPAWNDDPRYLAGLPDSLRLVHLGQSAYGCLTALKQMIPHRLSTLSGETLLSLTCWPFGLAVTLLPLFAVRRVAVTALRYAPYLALVYAQLLFASNTERLLAFAFPPLILLALDGAETIRERLRLSASSLLLLPAALIPLHLLAPGRIDLPLKDQALLFCVAFAFLFQRRERPVTAPVVEAARVARQPGISPLRAARESFPELVQDH